jgi:hypothetical protein
MALADNWKFCVADVCLTGASRGVLQVAGDTVHLTGFPVSSFNNFIHPSVDIGSKSTVSGRPPPDSALLAAQPCVELAANAWRAQVRRVSTDLFCHLRAPWYLLASLLAS